MTADAGTHADYRASIIAGAQEWLQGGPGSAAAEIQKLCDALEEADRQLETLRDRCEVLEVVVEHMPETEAALKVAKDALEEITRRDPVQTGPSPLWLTAHKALAAIRQEQQP